MPESNNLDFYHLYWRQQYVRLDKYWPMLIAGGQELLVICLIL